MNNTEKKRRQGTLEDAPRKRPCRGLQSASNGSRDLLKRHWFFVAQNASTSNPSFRSNSGETQGGSPSGFSVNSPPGSDVISESHTTSSSTTDDQDPSASELSSRSSSDGIVEYVEQPAKIWNISPAMFCEALGIAYGRNNPCQLYLDIRDFTRGVYKKHNIDSVPPNSRDPRSAGVSNAVDEVCPGNRYTLMA